MSTPDDDVPAILAQRPDLLTDAAQRALRYLAGLDARPVAPAAAAVAGLDRLDFPLPTAGRPGPDVLALLDEAASPATVASGGPRYFGFVTGGALPAAQAAAWLTAAWDQNAALSVMSPAAARLDAVALRWVTELLGLPPGSGGGFVTGATMANATCLAAARDAVLSRHGWDAAGQGLAGAPPVTVLVGEQVHATVRKALGLIGLGRDRAVLLPADAQGRIVPRSLPLLNAGPVLVCLQAGNVNSGASDPFGDLIPWAHEQGAWVHVDGAFGLWAAAAPGLAGQVAGVAAADSWATDAHKWLNTTYDCGIALVRDPAALRAAMQASAAYLPAAAHREAMNLTPQSSQRARGAEVWAVLTSLGRDGVAGLVDRTCRAGPPVRRRAARSGLPGAQRRAAQPGPGQLRRPGPDGGRGGRGAAGRDLLVRADGLAGPAGHADQCQRLEHHRGRHRPQPGRRAGLRQPARTGLAKWPA